METWEKVIQEYKELIEERDLLKAENQRLREMLTQQMNPNTLVHTKDKEHPIGRIEVLEAQAVELRAVYEEAWEIVQRVQGYCQNLEARIETLEQQGEGNDRRTEEGNTGA